MATLNEIIQKRIERVSAVPNEFLTEVDKLNKNLLKEVEKLLSELDVSNGQILLNSNNLDKIIEIEARLKEVFQGKEYVEALRSFASEFEKQRILNEEYFKILGQFSDSDLYKATVSASQKQAVRSLILPEEFSNELIDILNAAVSSEQRFSDAVDQFRKVIIQDERYKNYAKQIVFDSFAISDRRAHRLMAQESGLKYYRYEGSIKDTTRCFCRERAGKVYHIDQYKAWGRGEDIGRCETENDWDGRNENTNENSILDYLGGYNCRHLAFATGS